MRIIDMVASPNYNPETNRGRGNWSLTDVSEGMVVIGFPVTKPECVEHGAMNCVNEQLTIWRCLNCGRSCFDLDRFTP